MKPAAAEPRSAPMAAWAASPPTTAWPPLHLVGHNRPWWPRLLVPVGQHRTSRRPRWPRSAGARLPAARWRALATTQWRSTRAATGDALRAARRRWPPVCRPRQRSALGQSRPGRQLSPVRITGCTLDALLALGSAMHW